MSQINTLIKPTNECNMRCKYCFAEKYGYSDSILDLKILKIYLPSYSKNIFAKIYCKLSENLDIYSSYLGEDNSIYIETSNNKRAINCIKSILR